MADYIQTGITNIKELFSWLNERSRSKDVLRNDLLREMRDNLKLLEHRNKEGVHVRAILQGLSAAKIEAAYSGNYNLRSLAHMAKLPAGLILNKRQEKYIGWDAEQFIYSIEGKIKDLKNLPALYKDLDQAPVNLTLRLDNLYFQLLLLAVFIRNQR
ncbi:MAG: hypothetical protein R2794_11640 [Chitinophagales bacterium]